MVTWPSRWTFGNTAQRIKEIIIQVKKWCAAVKMMTYWSRYNWSPFNDSTINTQQRLVNKVLLTLTLWPKTTKTPTLRLTCYVQHDTIVSNSRVFVKRRYSVKTAQHIVGILPQTGSCLGTERHYDQTELPLLWLTVKTVPHTDLLTKPLF